MNVEEFCNVVMYSLMKNLKDYYVKGGKCYDFYFKKKSNSPDWDIVATPETHKKLLSKLEEYAKLTKLKLQSRQTFIDDLPMYQYGFIGYSIAGDPFLIDVVIKKDLSSTDYTKIGDINYMQFEKYIVDLLRTYDIRSDSVKTYIELSNNGQIIKDFDKFRMKYKFIDVTKIESFEKLTQQTLEFLRKILQSISDECYKKYFKVVDVLIKSNVKTPEDFDDIFKSDDYDPELLKDESSGDEIDDDEIFEKMYDILQDYYETIILGWTSYQLNKEEYYGSMSKFKRIHKRLTQIIDINWDNLSNEYKIYLLDKCRNSNEIKLFNINDNCMAVLKCASSNIEKKTDKCKEKLLEIE